MGLCSGLAPSRWQAINWNNDDLVHWHFCASLESRCVKEAKMDATIIPSLFVGHPCLACCGLSYQVSPESLISLFIRVWHLICFTTTSSLKIKTRMFIRNWCSADRMSRRIIRKPHYLLCFFVVWQRSILSPPFEAKPNRDRQQCSLPLVVKW